MGLKRQYYHNIYYKSLRCQIWDEAMVNCTEGEVGEDGSELRLFGLFVKHVVSIKIFFLYICGEPVA